MGGHLAHRADDQGLEPRGGQQAVHLRVEQRRIQRDQQVGLAVGHLVGQHLLGVQRRVVDDHAAGLQHREKADQVVRRVGQEQAYVHARAHAQRLQALGGAGHQLAELAVAEQPAHEVDRGAVGKAGDGVVEDAVDRADVDRVVPTQVGRVGVDPGGGGLHGRLLVAGAGRAGFRAQFCAQPPAWNGLILARIGRPVATGLRANPRSPGRHPGAGGGDDHVAKTTKTGAQCRLGRGRFDDLPRRHPDQGDPTP